MPSIRHTLLLQCILILGLILGICSAFHIQYPMHLPRHKSLSSERLYSQCPCRSPVKHVRISSVGPLNQFVKGLVDEEDDKLKKEDIPALKGEVPLDTLMNLDIRAATIAFAETIPDPEHDNKPSRKYLKLKMEMGIEQRIIVSAMRGILDVEECVGKKVLLVANVPKETIMGIESHGRILIASNPTKEPIPRTLRTVMLKPGNLPSGSTIYPV